MKAPALTLTNLLALGAVGTAGYFGVKAYNKKQADKLLFTPEGQIAASFWNALNPSGISFFRNFDGTEENSLYKAGRDMIAKGMDVPKVSKIFKKMYGKFLSDRLQNDLSPSELKDFFDAINLAKPGESKSAPANAKVQATINDLIITKTRANIRKTPTIPKATYSNPLRKNENIIRTVDANVFLGVFTGKTFLEPDTDIGPVLWYEVRTFKSKYKDGNDPFSVKSELIYVAGSNIRAVPVTKEALVSYKAWKDFAMKNASTGYFVIDEFDKTPHKNFYDLFKQAKASAYTY